MINLEYSSPKISDHFYQSIDDIIGDIPFIKDGRKGYVANVPAVFDIESSSFYDSGEKRCTMYAWVFGINGRCIRGRTWPEFLSVIDKVVEIYGLSVKKRLIVYVHNLAYEFQWFKNLFNWDCVFSTDIHKPVYARTTNGIEFRCSYILSGYNLETLGKNLAKYKVDKKVGDLDYNKIRHSNTVLTDTEWGYILNDGLVVMAHIQEEIERIGDIRGLPLTKTGYVRQLCREKCLKGEDRFNYVRTMRSLTLTVDNYYQLKRAYTGGFTHANANYVDRVIDNVHSYDFSSSYPSVMLSERFPMSRAHKKKIYNEKDFMDMLKNYCCMFDIEFIDIRSEVKFENYISYSKCQLVERPIINNGRIIEASRLIMTITEQDFFIISKMYSWGDMYIDNFYYFYKDYLPKPFVETILQLYKSKTELKGVNEKLVEYMVAKNMINACYGMCVTDPCRDEIQFEDNYWFRECGDVKSLIESYNKNMNRVLYYPWGVWITAYARRNLFTGILEFGDDYVYSDTDSIKVIHPEKHEEYLKKYNTLITAKVKRCLDHYGLDSKLSSPVTIKGVSKPIGVWDYEGSYNRFKTLGAKRYLVETGGEISITIAGVAKGAGAQYLRDTFKNNNEIFENFTEGVVFPAEYVDPFGETRQGCGKLLHTYINMQMDGYVTDYLGVTSAYHEESGVHLEPTEYSLSFADEFRNLILGIKGGHLAL